MSQLLALAGFGFLLGMRHATDADHVIAVTTILNRSRRSRGQRDCRPPSTRAASAAR